ncbi:YidH family protein [Allonocardiopsis opalescens]|uniref:Putative membrane protein n=1 Tax=Allonocardiopsis opalescens TaxID=1144618 RepID=A0A2T0Q6K3_9ACTN|nr:DUF202 domain-containing protein [Allonocardiopsis opalescens]PRX99422.1 putative membrane protein [Allonocardiopsis opalescens]
MDDTSASAHRQADGPAPPAGEHEPDYRFTLANERTFLAWIRTALGLLAGGVAVLHIVPVDWPGWLRLSVGLGLSALAVCIALAAPVRWHRVQRAMRRSAALPTSLLPLVLSAGVALVCLAAIAADWAW